MLFYTAAALAALIADQAYAVRLATTVTEPICEYGFGLAQLSSAQDKTATPAADTKKEPEKKPEGKKVEASHAAPQT